MKIFVKKVETGAEYEGKIYDYWINGQTESGRCIKIFDSVPFDVRGDVGNKIDCLLLAGFLKGAKDDDTEDNVIRGNFIGEYELPIQIVRIRNDARGKRWLAAQTIEGVVLLSPDDLMVKSLSIGEMVRFRVGRFDLIGIA
jgi:hypothetical protein